MTPTPPFTGPTVSDRERALATLGTDDAEQTIAATEQFLDLDGIYRPQPGQSFAEHRESIRLGAPWESPTAVDDEIAGVPVRRLAPADGAPLGMYLHLHGGGWALGSHRSSDARLQPLADETGLEVISVGYRLAPEHPYPAPIDDVLTVATALAGRYPVAAIGGESAGAHLAALTLQRLAAAGGQYFDAALLIYGCFDVALTPDSTSSGVAQDLFLPDVPRTARRDPRYSPLFGDLHQMPPARFVVGTRDALLSDTLMMAARWQLFAPAEVEVVCGAAHAFTLLDIPAAEQTLAGDRGFLAAAQLRQRSAGIR